MIDIIFKGTSWENSTPFFPSEQALFLNKVRKHSNSYSVSKDFGEAEIINEFNINEFENSIGDEYVTSYCNFANKNTIIVWKRSELINEN